MTRRDLHVGVFNVKFSVRRILTKSENFRYDGLTHATEGFLMRFLQGLVLVLALFVVSRIFANGTGYSSHPIPEAERMINIEAIGITSDNGGLGIQGRYTHRLNTDLTLDGGLGISGGDRESRVFVGADYMLFPDYEMQPRFSLKGAYTLSNEFDSTTHNWSIAPTVSKGLSIWDQEIYPFLAVPVGLQLISEGKKYETTITASLGATAPLMIENAEKLFVNAEINIDLKDSYTGFFTGLGYQF